jgi:hypothetical protein
MEGFEQAPPCECSKMGAAERFAQPTGTECARKLPAASRPEMDTAVVEFENPDRKREPYQTATVQFQNL